MSDFNTNTKNNDEWLTPKYITDALGVFYIDPCSPINRPWNTAQVHFNKKQDGLNQCWVGRIWLNPPYGRETFKWLDKLAKHELGIALIFARTETKGFHQTVWDKANSVFFFKGRLKFHKVDGSLASTANAPSCLISYSFIDTAIIERRINEGILKGKLVKLK